MWGSDVHSSARIDDESLVGVGVCQLSGSFVGGEVGEAAGRDLLPEFGGDAEETAFDEGGRPATNGMLHAPRMGNGQVNESPV